ncbi:hypothetical protein OG760_37360 (plasmid) [Streptomyces sp. NBC_00963]|uniref:hypothetical protein n=1 Tax=Streptomyces sp. NBC_00963 TaxID=2903697 RepID=UPI002F9069C1|nr:hypothetical protein OG760_37360 [Streptomyces sp. NBC_00963]
MATQQPTAEDCIPFAVAQLVTVFENLGAEHQALMAEGEKTAAKERRGTVLRMGEGIASAAHTVNQTVGVLAAVHGMRALGINRQFAKDSEGRDYSPLNTLGSPAETLFDVAGYLDAAANTLKKAYGQTRKHPGLAVARCPRQMSVALSGLRVALETVCLDLNDTDEAVAEYASAQEMLSELEKRVCRPVPAQGTGLTPDEVAAAIRANPDVARAAAVALAAERLTHAG